MSESKKCPFCGEEILNTAIKCKHCGEFLEKTVEKKYTTFNYSFNLEYSRKQFLEFLEKRFFLKNVHLNTRTWSETTGGGSSWGNNGYVNPVSTKVYSLFDISFNLEVDEKIKISKEYIHLCYQYFNLNYKTNIFLLIFIFILSFFIQFPLINLSDGGISNEKFLFFDSIISLFISIIVYRIKWNNFVEEKKSLLEGIKNYKILGEGITLEQNNNLKFNAEYKTIKTLVLICTILIILLFTFPNLFNKINEYNNERYNNEIINIENALDKKVKNEKLEKLTTEEKVRKILLPYKATEVKSVHFKYNDGDKYLIILNFDTIPNEKINSLKKDIKNIEKLESKKNIYTPKDKKNLIKFNNEIKGLSIALNNNIQKFFEGSEIEGFQDYMNILLSAR